MLRTPPWLRDVARLPRALLPDGRCRLCALASRAPLCSACQCAMRRAPAWSCERCAVELPAPAVCCGACALRPPAFARTVAWGDYAAQLDRLVARIKHGEDPVLARWLGRLLARSLRARWPSRQLAAAHVLPMPMTPAALRRRGYNQAWELALGLARELGWSADCRQLLRRREGPAQSSLPLARRGANVRGAFEVRALPRGTRVLLVDDVMTSGASAEHAARALLRAGAAEVAVAVLLRTPPPPWV